MAIEIIIADLIFWKISALIAGTVAGIFALIMLWKSYEEGTEWMPDD